MNLTRRDVLLGVAGAAVTACIPAPVPAIEPQSGVLTLEMFERAKAALRQCGVQGPLIAVVTPEQFAAYKAESGLDLLDGVRLLPTESVT